MYLRVVPTRINMICFLAILTLVNSQEYPTPSNQLPPRNFNYHSEQLRQYLEEVSPAPTKKGPVLFPNDAPPPPRPPLVVTSRPLTDSIARNELNNSIADSSYISPVTYRPSYNINYNNNFESTNKQLAIPRYHNDISSEQDYSEGQNYAFSYIVKDQKTGDDFSHKQQSIGSATNGEYRVRLPDGRVQIVSYTADDNGYKANVRYDDSNPVDKLNPSNYETNQNDVDSSNYNTHNDFNKVNTNYNNNLDNTNYDFNKINYRDEIPVKENQYDSKEYYDYSAENYKNPEPLYNPGSTGSPYSVSTTAAPFLSFLHNYQTTSAPFQQNYQTTTAPFQQNYHTTTAPFQQNYQPSTALFQQNYQSTLSPFKETYPTTAPFIASSTVRPSYNEIKHLFTTPNYNNIEVNSPSSYADNVVLIGAKNHYTDYNLNGENSLVSSTPTPYVLSSLRNLNDRINTKPVLSEGYIDRINKYLSFK